MKSIFLLMPFLFLMACTSEEPINLASTQEQQSTNKEQVQNALSLNQAMSRGETFFNEFFKEATRSKRVVKSVDYILNDSRTRGSDLPDTLFYVVNYEDDMGFMMLSADRRMNPVYALSDKGSLELSDTTFNKGLDAFYHNAIASAGDIPPILNLNDSSLIINPSSYSNGPLLSDHQQRLGQLYPYNAYCEEYLGIRAAVGCPAVAMEQVFSYHKYPYSIGGITMPWDEMNAGNNDDKIARALRYIGMMMHMDYHIPLPDGSFGSGVGNETYIFDAFAANDYSRGRLKTFSPSAVAVATNNGPVYMLCKQMKFGNNYGGHAWVTDGYKSTSIYEYLGPKYYLHCVWGWYGSSNGYYLWSDKAFVEQSNNPETFETSYEVQFIQYAKPLFNREK